MVLNKPLKGFVIIGFLFFGGCNNKKNTPGPDDAKSVSSSSVNDSSGIIISYDSGLDIISKIDTLSAFINSRVDSAKIDQIVKIGTFSDSTEKFYVIDFLSNGQKKVIILQSSIPEKSFSPHHALYCKEIRTRAINCEIKPNKDKETQSTYFECPCTGSTQAAKDIAL